MELLVGLLILSVLSVPLFVALRRANELFRISVREGRASHVSGRLPSPLLEDIREIVARPPLENAEIRVVSESSQPRVVVRGKIGEGQLQRLRNVVGRYQVQQIRAGKRRRRT
jgi:hypothetical protein